MTECISLKQNLGFLWEIPSRRGVLLKCHFFSAAVAPSMHAGLDLCSVEIKSSCSFKFT